MAISLNSKVVRVALNAASYGQLTDVLTKAPVVFPKADLRLEVGVFFGQVNTTLQLVDIANWVSFTCTFKALVGNNAPPGNAPTLAEVTVLAAALDAGLTAGTWADFSAQHAAFDFSEAQINALPNGALWCVFSALLVSGKVVPIAFGQVSTVEDGYGIADPAAVVDGTAYTKAEALALFARDRNDLIARTGGGAAALDGVATAAGAWATGQSIRTRSGALGGREEWILEAGDDAEDADAGIVRPDDYAPGTNERVWKQIL